MHYHSAKGEAWGIYGSNPREYAVVIETLINGGLWQNNQGKGESASQPQHTLRYLPVDMQTHQLSLDTFRCGTLICMLAGLKVYTYM